MRYETIEADIVQHVATNGGVLIHQVNCKQVAGRGLALQVRNRWPAWYRHFRNKTPILGCADIFPISTPTWPGIHIVSLYAQRGYGVHQGRQTDYDAFTDAVRHFAAQIARIDAPWRWAINHGGLYVPMGIGCGLAGGDWHAIERILTEHMPADFTICKLPA